MTHIMFPYNGAALHSVGSIGDMDIVLQETLYHDVYHPAQCLTLEVNCVIFKTRSGILGEWPSQQELLTGQN